MRRLAVVLAVVTLHGAPAAVARAVQEPQAALLQADPLVRLLADLENAIASGRAEDFRALAAPSLSSEDANRFLRASPGTGAEAVVRERARRPVTPGFDVVVDVLISRGRHGRIATWQLTVMPVPGTNERFALTALTELAAVDGLVRLRLDATRQFAVHDLSIDAPDLKLTLASGNAFVAETDNGVTAIVLRGRGSVRFTPSDPAEQGQVQLFARQPSIDTEIDSAFIRLNPAEFESLISAASLSERQVDARDLARAQEIFDDYSPRTFNLDLRTLSPDRWSLEPGRNSVVVEFRSRRHGWLTYARSPGEAEDISVFERGRGRNICVYASAPKLRERGRFYSEDTDEAYDVTHYALDLTFDPARGWISGRGSLRLRVKSGLATSLTIKLAQPLSVASVSSPHSGDLLALRIIGQNNVIVSLPRRLEPGAEIALDITYGGRLPPQPLDREAMAVQAQGVNQETPELILVPEPRFMYSNRVHWYPQAPVSDYATATLKLSVPSEYQIIASGTLRGASVASRGPNDSQVPARSMRTVEYGTDRPVRYLSCVISRFVPLGRTKVEVPSIAPPDGRDGAGVAGAVNLEVVATPRMTNRGRQLSARAAAILAFYASRIGEAPYPDFTLAAVDDNLPGGHSPAFFALLHQPLPTTPYSWASDPVAFDSVYPSFFLAHEIAHQWWGQAIGWKNYHEQWLSEGLAQYFAVLYAESDRGPDVLQSLLSEMRASTLPLLKQGPISLGYRLGHIRGEGAVFRAIVYNKSAVVLHMLRRLIGDEAFYAGLRQFYRDWRFQKAGTDDLRATFEAHTPMKLGRFFDRWVLGAAIPRVRVAVRPGPPGAPPVVHVEQLGEIFDFPLTVEVQYADGQNELLDLRITEAAVERPAGRNAAVRRVSVKDPLALVAIVR